MAGELIRNDVEEGDLRRMLREVTRPNGVRRLLRWLARQVDGSVTLLGGTGEPVDGLPGPPARLSGDAADVISSVVHQRRQSVSSDVGGCAIRALAIDTDATLVVARQGGFSSEAATAIADAASLVRLQWRVEQADRRRRQVDLAESFTREAILHLIMVGQLDGARRSAGALRQKLPDLLRVYLIERGLGGLDELIRLFTQASSGNAYIIPCPVYPNHLIVLAGAEPDKAASTFDSRLRKLAADRVDLRIGVSQTVALRQTPVGYEQAFHALAVARMVPTGFAAFSAQSDLVSLIGPAGRMWASQVLAPLLEFVPERSQDPDANELMSTLRSWLSFHGRAAAQLKIHRNTLTARIQRIERTLDRDLGDVATQATLYLALRLLDHMGRSSVQEPESLDVLLRSRPVHHWAESLLRPLAAKEPLLDTLRAWLDNNTRLEATATALNVSVPGIRKRLVRIEQALGRSLLNGPSARYDLLIALRLFDNTPLLSPVTQHADT